MKKKFLALLLALVMVIGMLPMAALAEEVTAPTDEEKAQMVADATKAEMTVSDDAKAYLVKQGAANAYSSITKGDCTLYFSSFKSGTLAVAKANEGTQIALNSNISVAYSDTWTNFEVNTNGHCFIVKTPDDGGVGLTLTGDDTKIYSTSEDQVALFEVIDGGTLTIQGGEYTSKGIELIKAWGTVKIEDGSFTTEAAEPDGRAMLQAHGKDGDKETHGKIIMTGGVIDATTSNNTTDSCLHPIAAFNGGTLEFGTEGKGAEGPVLKGGYTTIGGNNLMPGANVTIYSGTYSTSFLSGGSSASMYDSIIYAPQGGTYVIKGGEFTAAEGGYVISTPYTNAKVALTISDGTFTGELIRKGDKTGSESYDSVKASTTISGGTFSVAPEDVDSGKLIVKTAEGYKVLDGLSTVTPGTQAAALRGAGPAVGNEDEYNYASKYGTYGITYASGKITVNEDTLKTIMAEDKTADKTALTHEIHGTNYLFVGLQLTKPDGATSVALAESLDTQPAEDAKVDLNTESEAVHNGNYIQYYGVAQWADSELTLLTNGTFTDYVIWYDADGVILAVNKLEVTREKYVAPVTPPSTGGNTGNNTTTETVKNPDGSTTTTTENKTTGTVTETTKYTDGSQTVVETKKDGTVTTTDTDAAGNKTATVENTDGSSKTTVAKTDGSSSTTTVDTDGQVEAEVKLSSKAVAAATGDGPVALPMPEVPVTTDRETAPTVTVDLPSGTSTAKVEIPVENVTPGTVAVIVKADGTEEIVKTSVTTENGVAVTLNDGDTVKVVDNSKTFVDVPASHWSSEAVDFASSRELFQGTSETTFSPDVSMTRGMFVTALARFDGVDTNGGSVWYDKGVAWAVENKISDGTDPEAPVTREQMITMIWNYAGRPAASGSALAGYTDASSVSDYASGAMSWAVSVGLVNGVGSSTLDPQGTATRAQVATLLMRYIEQIAAK